LNKLWIACHLEEAIEELQRTLKELKHPEYSESEFRVAMAHAYNHLNTAWNSRNADPDGVASLSEEEFYRSRAYPSDLDMGR
jgi:hypothetical protein